MIDLPPLQESRPRDSQTRRGKKGGVLDTGQSSLLLVGSASERCSLESEVLDGMDSCLMSSLMEVAEGSLA